MSTFFDGNIFKSIDDWLLQALELIQAKQWMQAEHACEGALNIDPYHAEANHLAGLIAGQIGQEDKGLIHFQIAIKQEPHQPQYLYNYAVCLGLKGREKEAAIQYQACLRLNPNHRDALWAYSEILRLADHLDLAAELLERFVANGGNYRGLNHRLRVIHSALRNDDVADMHFLEELRESDAQVDALTQCEYSLYSHDFERPAWHGRFTNKSTLLIHGEQWLGDEIMFASLVPEVLEMARATESRVILATKPALVRLFAASFPLAVVISHGAGDSAADISMLGKIDWQLPIGNLPSVFRFQVQDFQMARKIYLFACPQRTQWYAEQLAAIEASKNTALNASSNVPFSKLKVGLMWGTSSAAVHSKFACRSRQRSVPVHMFERLVAMLPEVLFVSLQKSERGHEASLAPKLDIFDLSNLQTDFLDAASLIANMDLVISVDSSVSHLAGAMAKETWVPLIQHSDWRHGNKRKSSYWYANTRYFHQTDAQNWTPVMNELAAELRLRVDKMHEKHMSMYQISASVDACLEPVSVLSLTKQ
jgi:Glycosyltransferase family 9 (heptosyltransferase)